MFKRILKIGGFSLAAIFIVATLAFTSMRYKNAICKRIDVVYNEGDRIRVDKSEIIQLVNNADKHLQKKHLEEINAVTIEKAIEKHKAILKADVFKVVVKEQEAYNGVLTVNVKHRDPVVRIVKGTGGYFLDEYGGKIPVSTKYTANVLVATGNISEAYAKEKLLPCVMHMEQDEFWQAQIEQIHVKMSGEVLLIPLVGEHIVELGDISDYPGKLRNLKAFYKQVLANNNWNKYKTISLKYKNQVIAKRR